MENLTFIGSDVNLEESLFEYGVIVSNEEHEDGSGTHFVVYKINENEYGTGHVSEKELDHLVKGDDWMYKDDIESYLSTDGTTLEEWLKLSLIQKLQSLISYWGYENIMGTDYSPVNEKFVTEKYLK